MTTQNIYDLADTWNAGATTFTAIKMNVTDTASAAGSLLMDLQVGGSSRFKVSKGGTVNFQNGVEISVAGGVDFATNSVFRSGTISFGASSDAILGRRSAANLRLGAADAAAPVAQTLSVQSATGTNTPGVNWTFDASQGTGSGAGGSFVWRVAPAGSSGSAQNALTEALRINSAGVVSFGGTTSSFPALKRSSATLQVRLADDSANGALESASLKTDAPTGGTSGTWKLGARVAATTTLDTTQYIELDVGGTLYKLAVVTS